MPGSSPDADPGARPGVLKPLAAWLALLGAGPLAAQHDPPRATVDAAGQAVPALTHVDPIPGGPSRTELRVVHPVLMVRGAVGAWRLQLTLNGEGTTLRHGELAPGVSGEGFMDRRHPHTYVHELMLTGADLLRGAVPALRLSLSAGKGFVPFGTDDPMSRPVLRFPVNHHLAQILERAVAIASAGTGPIQLEGALFNGDEPERPSQSPNWGRFGDSWAARVTAVPLRGLELQGSLAHVHSPEHRPGSGPDQDKWSASARWTRSDGYALVEWAHTSEASGFYGFTSLLAEGQLRRRAHRVYARLERSDRAEEERTADPFRAVRPHLDDALLGITRWSVATVGYGYRMPLGVLDIEAEPVIEGSAGRVRETTGSLFDPASFYGRETFWTVTLAVRIARGLGGHRMGRYGVFPGADPAGAGHGH